MLADFPLQCKRLKHPKLPIEGGNIDIVVMASNRRERGNLTRGVITGLLKEAVVISN